MSRRVAARTRALAKINLSLRILGTHADGYHELRTVFQSLALHDVLIARPAPGPLTLTTDDAQCPADGSNLVMRAATRLWRAAGRRGTPSGVALHLVKRIPMQAGLGGGSSDAAAALRLLAHVWSLSIAEPALHAIARELGADVAYFLVGGTALGAGRGEVLYPLEERPAQSVVLVQPPFGVSTREAYGWWDDAHAGGGLATGEEHGNDLEAPVVGHHPEIGRIVKQLRRAGAVSAAMSGSGSVVFGLFPDQGAALDAADLVRGRGRTVLTTRTVSRRAYGRLTAISR